MQPGQKRQRQDRRLGEGQADGHRHDDPVVATGRGHAFLGGGDRVAEPTQAPDGLAAFVRERVIDEQRDGTGELQPGQDQDGEVVGQRDRVPGGTFEEIVVSIQTVTLGMVAQLLGLRIVGDAAEAVLSQTENPSEKELAVRGEGSRSKGGCERLDDGFERGYHSPHEGFLPSSHDLRIYAKS